MTDPDEELLPTRSSLLSRLKDWNDQESWRVFFDTYWKLIYQTAIKAGLTNAEAEDVVQETVIRVCRSMPAFRYRRQVSSFKSWLLRLTEWRIADHLRRRLEEVPVRPLSTDATHETSVAERVADPKGLALEAIWDQEWRKNLVDAALARIRHRVDEKHYQIFDLLVLKQWPVAKLTKTLGISAARVYLVKHRVNALLKREIKTLETRLL